MSVYLARLKQLESVRNSLLLLDALPPEPPKDPFEGFDGMGTGQIEKNIVAIEIVTSSEDDCLHTLAQDYAELKTLIIKLCKIAGYSDENQSRMLTACRNLYPYQYTEQRDYFRLQVESATAGRYWTGETTH